MTIGITTPSGAQSGFVEVAPDSTGKRISNFAVQMYVDNQDGNGPVLQTVFLQAVLITQLDENGVPIGVDDRVDYEWKRQLLDEMRAIRIGMEHLLETGRPSFDPSQYSLVDEARAQRLDDALERREQES